MTEFLGIDKSEFEVPKSAVPLLADSFPLNSYRSALINALVYIHKSSIELSSSSSGSGRKLTVSPGDFLDFTKQFVKIFNEKSEELEDQQRHFNVGVEKLWTQF